MSQRLTIIIPTYNRPDQFGRTVRCLQRYSSPLQIIVADGSSEEHSSRNAQCRDLGENIRYFHIPLEPLESAWRNYSRRIQQALDQLETPYAALCADDDLLVAENAVHSAEFLEGNPQYVGCHGNYLQFQYVQDRIEIPNIEYQGNSIDADEISGRLMQLFSRYEAPYYAVFRTPILRLLFKRSRETEPPLWPEIYHSTSAVIAGKIHRNNTIYYLRNIGIPPHYRSGTSFLNFGQWVAADFDGFLAHYFKYRACVLQWAGSGADREVLHRALDMAFITYIGLEFDAPYWVDRCVETVTEKDEQEKLRFTLSQNLYRARASGSPPTISSAGRELFKSIIGKEAIALIRCVHEKGMASAIERARETLIRRIREKSLTRTIKRARKTKSGWTVAYESSAGQDCSVHVAPWIMKRFPAEQWNLLCSVVKSN